MLFAIAPALASQPALPPFVGLFQLAPLLRGQRWTGLWNRMQRPEADRCAEFVDSIRFGQPPGSRSSVGWVVHPLRSESLRAAFVHGDAVFKVGGMPRRCAAFRGADLKQVQHGALKLWLADGVLGDKPGCLC